VFPGERWPGYYPALFSFAFCCTMGLLASRWWFAGAAAVLAWLLLRLGGWLS